MENVHDYKFLGLAAVILLVAGLAFILFKWPQGKSLTFSQHVAMRKTSIIYYVVLFSIILPLLLIFFIGWLTPTLQLSPWFNFFVILASISQFCCALIPETGAWRTKWHQTLAGLSAICLLPALLFLISSSQVNNLSKILGMVGFLSMCIIIYLLIINKGKHSHLILFQSAYFIAFFIPVISASYT